jgi:hypothetical protein
MTQSGNSQSPATSINFGCPFFAKLPHSITPKSRFKELRTTERNFFIVHRSVKLHAVSLFSDVWVAAILWILI